MLRRAWSALLAALASILARWADGAHVRLVSSLQEDNRDLKHANRLLESRNAIQASEIVSLALRCEREAERFRADIAALIAKRTLSGEQEKTE